MTDESIERLSAPIERGERHLLVAITIFSHEFGPAIAASPAIWEHLLNVIHQRANSGCETCKNLIDGIRQVWPLDLVEKNEGWILRWRYKEPNDRPT